MRVPSSSSERRTDTIRASSVVVKAMRRYVVIVEQGPASYGAYVSDLPGCVAVAETEDDVKTLIREAIEFHLEGRRDAGQPISEPTSRMAYVEV